LPTPSSTVFTELLPPIRQRSLCTGLGQIHAALCRCFLCHALWSPRGRAGNPSRLERLLILLVQGAFFNFYFLLYLVSPRIAHQVVGYLEEEAVYSYSEYLLGVHSGRYANVPAPQVAINYWKLPAGALLRDVIVAVRADEMLHRDVNHQFADALEVGGA
jgi:hypothetical protein